MCGIVGYISTMKQGIKTAESVFFRDLLIADAVRGMDGTGILKVNRQGEVQTMKKAGGPSELFASSNYDQFHLAKKKETIKVLIGHNRFATRGDYETESAHPFMHGNITLVHNGTLDKETTLPEFHKFKVDSSALCFGINKLGIEQALRQTRGAYALAFFNKEDQTVNLIRNICRPLFTCSLFNEKALAFASEPEMLEWILRRTFKQSNMVIPLHIKELPCHQLMTIDLKSGQIEHKQLNVYPLPPQIQDLRPTTTAKQLTALNPHIPASSLDNASSRADRYTSVKIYNGYHIGQEIVFLLMVTEELSDDQQGEPRWLMIGLREDLPDVEMRFICRSWAEKKALEASPAIVGKIKYMSYDLTGNTGSPFKVDFNPCNNKEHKMYLGECKPCNIPAETKDISGRSVLRKIFDAILCPTKTIN